MSPPTSTPTYLSYKSLPLEQFKVTHRFEDPFLKPRRSFWRPFRSLRARLDRANAHRRFVGKNAGSKEAFEMCCRFQLDFLMQRGLTPDDTLLDLGCGSLRGGLHFIRFLQPGNYLGMDISAEVVWRGITRELGQADFQQRKPEFVISDCFEFAAFSRRPRFAIANSVFTHLPPGQIELCLGKYREFIGDGESELFATFTEVSADSRHDVAPHYLEGNKGQFGSKGRLDYTRDEMHDLGRSAGWHTEYIGVWGHPKNEKRRPRMEQRMFRFATR